MKIKLSLLAKHAFETLVGKGNKRAKGVLELTGRNPENSSTHPNRYYFLIGIVSGAYGGATIADDVEPLFALIPGVAACAKTLAMITVVAIYHLSVAHHRRIWCPSPSP